MPLQDAQDHVRRMKKAVLFKYLDDEMLAEIIRVSDVVEYDAEERIIEQGEEDPFLYVVLTGSVSVSVKEESGKDVYITTIGEGDVIGEAGMFVKTPRTASVTADMESTLLKVHRQQFLGFVKSEPGAGIKMLMIIIFSLLRKLKEANQELAFERKTLLEQDDIDSLIDGIMKD